MKKTIQLKESDITRMVMETVNELDWKTYDNATEKARLRGDDREDAFRGAAMDKFRNEFEYEEGEYPNHKRVIPTVDWDGYLSGIDVYKENVPNACGEPDCDWMTYHPDGKLSKDGYHYCEGGGGGRTSIPRHKHEFFKGKDDNALRGAFDRATSEWDNHKKGNYEYIPGIGWRLKYKNESIVREAVNRTLRKYIR